MSEKCSKRKAAPRRFCDRTEMVWAGTRNQGNTQSSTTCSWAGSLSAPGLTLEPCEDLQDSTITRTELVNSSQQTNKQLLGLWTAVPTGTQDTGFGRPPLRSQKVKTNWLSELHCTLFTHMSGFWPTHRHWNGLAIRCGRWAVEDWTTNRVLFQGMAIWKSLWKSEGWCIQTGHVNAHQKNPLPASEDVYKWWADTQVCHLR